jgi:hypothetical protein
MGIRSYFRGAMLARMSSGTYCIIRPLGLVKGGKGLRHHENLLTLTVNGVALKLVELLRGPAEEFRPTATNASTRAS